MRAMHQPRMARLVRELAQGEDEPQSSAWSRRRGHATCDAQDAARAHRRDAIVAGAASRGESQRTSTDTDPESDSGDEHLSTTASEADTDLSEYGDDSFWKSVEHMKTIPIAFDQPL